MKAQKTTQQYALMLSFIFKYVNDERLLSYVYTLMTKYQISTTTIFGHFLPHMKDYMDITPYKPLYNEVWDELEGWRVSLTHIVKYYKDLAKHFPQLGDLPSELYREMVLKQLEYFQVVDVNDEEMVKKVRESLEGEVFGEK